MNSLEGIPATTVAQEDVDVRPPSPMKERVSALRKPRPGAPTGFVRGNSVQLVFNFGQSQTSRS